MRVDLVDKVEHDADRDEKARAAEETRKAVADVKRIRNERRNDRDDRKERSADVRDSEHDLLQIVRRAAAGTITLDKRAASD